MSRNTPSQELSPEAFQNHTVLQHEFIKRISKVGWMPQQLKASRHQRENDFKETQVKPVTHDALVGSDYLDTLSPISYLAKNSGSIVDTEAVYYFSFICVPVSDMPPIHALTRFGKSSPTPLESTQAGQYLLALQQRLSTDPHWSLQLPRPSIKEINAWGPNVLPFINALGLEPYWRSHPSIEHWKAALVPVAHFLRKLEEFTYSTFVMDTVSSDITNLIPSWNKLNEQTKKHLIVHVHNAGNSTIDQMIAGDFHHIIVRMQDHLPKPIEFLNDYLTYGHEYSHAIVQEYFFGSTKRMGEVKNPQLMGMIHEAVAITVEQALIKANSLESQTTTLPGWATRRGVETKEVLQGRRDRDLADYPLAPKLTHYTEGHRIARKLQAKGWRVEDIPVLLQRIREIVFQVLKTKDVYKIYTVGLTFDPASSYQEIIRSLLEEKPPQR